MAIAVSLFAAGMWLLYQMPALPGWPACAATALLALAAASRPAWRPVAVFLAGFIWANCHALIAQPPLLPGDLERGLFDVQGEVVSLVRQRNGMTRFVLDAEALSTADRSWQGKWRFRLTWRDTKVPPLPGDRLSLSVRLKHVHGFASPGAWDYEGWLIWRGIRYTGYVVDSTEQGQSDPAACCPLTRLRSHLSTAVDGLPLSADTRAIVRALTVADRSGISTRLNERFSATGTSHLMAISGLHIGLVAGLGFLLCASVWRHIPALAGRVPSVVAGAIAALALGTSYALLAGMTLPTQRALIMLAVFAGSVVGRQRAAVSSSIAFAALCVLCWHPPAIISAGFWLSFGAVVTIVAALRHVDRRPRWRAALFVQLALGLALWPILALFDMPAAIGAPLANIVLVPLFGFVIVPVSLIGVALLPAAPAIGGGVLGLLEPLLHWVLEGLAWVALGNDLVGWSPSRDVWASMSALICLAFLFAPRGFPLRWAMLPMLLLPWLPRQLPFDQGAFALHVLDVGQGLSAVVQTQTHTLVFDTGPAFGSGFATSKAVLVPFLRDRGLRRIDRLVLSHGDIDHAGGVDQLRSAVEVARIDSGEPVRVGNSAGTCRAGENWQWDGVDFRFLHPPPGTSENGNNASCVLRVTGRGGSILLTGDIERRVEQHLVTAMPAELASDILVAPHHGSRSSSSAAFVAASSPQYVLYTTGWGNRYGFPASDVDLRWQRVGAVRLNTAATGTISFLLDEADVPLRPHCHRVHSRRFWWHHGGSAEGCHAVSSGDRRESPERASSSPELSALEDP